MNPIPARSASLNDAALDTLFAGSAERLLAAYLRNALHTIAPNAVAYWAEVISASMAAEAAVFSQDATDAREYHALMEALTIDAARLRGGMA